jgi:hypothetical protein
MAPAGFLARNTLLQNQKKLGHLTPATAIGESYVRDTALPKLRHEEAAI